MKTKLLSILRWTTTALLLLFLGNLLWLSIEASATPGPLSVESKTVAFEPRLAIIIDQQWKRDGSVPTAADVAAYETLLADMSKVDYKLIEQEGQRVEAMEASADKVYRARAARCAARYEWLEPKVGPYVAVLSVALDPSVAAADHRQMKLHRRSYQLAHQRGVRASARYHFAMALYLNGETDKAVLQLVKIMEEVPDYALINDMYIIGARLKAGDNELFVSSFAKIGGNIDRLRNDYDGTQKLFPHYVVSPFDYEPR